MKTKKAPSLSEKLSVQAIIEYCGKDRIKSCIFEPNGDDTAPDFELEYEKDGFVKKINLEIRGDYGAIIDEDPYRVRECRNQDHLKGFNENLNNLDNRWIENEEITATFLTKIPSKKECGIPLCKLIKPLHKELRYLYKANKIPIKHFTKESKKNTVECYFKIVVKGKEFAFSAYKNTYPKKTEKKLFIYVLPSLCDEFGSEKFQAQWGIKNSIQDKTEKLSKVEGEKWLGIYNGNYLVTKNHYITAYHYLITEKAFAHPSFTRIFVVFSDIDPEVPSDIVELTKDYQI